MKRCEELAVFFKVWFSMLLYFPSFMCPLLTKKLFNELKFLESPLISLECCRNYCNCWDISVFVWILDFIGKSNGHVLYRFSHCNTFPRIFLSAADVDQSPQIIQILFPSFCSVDWGVQIIAFEKTSDLKLVFNCILSKVF